MKDELILTFKVESLLAVNEKDSFDNHCQLSHIDLFLMIANIFNQVVEWQLTYLGMSHELVGLASANVILCKQATSLSRLSELT